MRNGNLWLSGTQMKSSQVAAGHMPIWTCGSATKATVYDAGRILLVPNSCEHRKQQSNFLQLKPAAEG